MKCNRKNLLTRGALLPLGLLTLFGGACRTDVTTNGNTPTIVSTTNSNATNTNAANSNAPEASAGVVAAREPEQYQAKLNIKIDAQGNGQRLNMPPLAVTVARNGTDRRYSFKTPDGSDLVYLDQTDKRYVLLPQRKQFAEVTKESTGFEIPRIMTPGQMVATLQARTDYALVGEENYGGRPALKYRFTGKPKTGTQADNTTSIESFLFLDKETGLPLYMEADLTSSQSNAGGTAKIVTTMTDITTNVQPDTFTVPQGYAEIPAEQVRAQVNLLLQVAAGLLRQGIGMTDKVVPPVTGNANAATTSPTPAASPR